MTFSAERMRALSRQEAVHFWFAGRRRLVTQALERRLVTGTGLVVDLGCGTGAMCEGLARSGHTVLGLDALRDGIGHMRAHGSDAPLAQADAAAVPLRSAAASVVLLLDVLEHLDDAAALAEAARILKPRGVLLVTVPAYPFLWSYRDEAAGHRRRYTRKALEAALGKAGFVIESVEYYQCLLLPLVVVSRILGRRRPALRDREDRPPQWLNRLLGSVTRLETSLRRWVRWPAGSTLFAVCRTA